MRSILITILALPCFGTTTVTITRPATAKAGVSGSITLTATVTGPAGTILWTHISGPGTGTFGTPTSTSTTFTAPTRSTTSADYVARATYINSDGTTTADVHVGAVLVDANDIVILPTSTATEIAINKMVGSPDGVNVPLLRGYAPTTMGTYYDIGDAAIGDVIATAAIANPPHDGTPLTGTFQATATGCSNGGSCLVGTGSNLTAECNPSCALIIHWNDPVDGVGTGRHWDDCTYVDNTHCNLSDFATYFTYGTGLSVYLQAGDTATYQRTWWMNGSGNGLIWKYYAVELALYRLFYRTGILSFLTQARQLSDYHWTWQIDHGTKGENPRTTNLQAQFLRALDGHPERLPSLYTYALYFATGPANIQQPHDLIGNGLDAREAAFALWHVALGAVADPDPTRHAGYCAALATIVPLWNTWQQPNGYWSENQPSFGGGYTYYAPGSSPWRTDIPVHALQASYDAFYDTSATTGCNNRTLAQTTFGSIQKAAKWIYGTGRAAPTSGGNGGVYFDAEYETLGEIVGVTVSGTMSVTLTSNAVTGVGTAFTTDFGACRGARYVMFSTNTVYRVVDCADATHMTIYPAFGYWGEVANLVAGTAVRTDRAYTCKNFTGTVGVLCGDVDDGSRDLSRLVPSLYGWLYWHSGDVWWLVPGDAFFINSFGGPANGPGGLLACNGTGCDGYETDWKGAAPSCSISANPPTVCNSENYGGGNVFHYLGKNYGQGGGAPAAQTYLAWRVMTPNPRPLPNRQIISGRVINRAVIR